MKDGKTAGILAAVGGAAAIAGAFLPWAKMTLSGVAANPGMANSMTVNGFVSGASDGYVAVAAGVIGVIVGLLFISGKTSKFLAVIAILGGLVGMGIGIYDIGQTKSLMNGERDKIKAEAMTQMPAGTTLTPEQETQLNSMLDQIMDGIKVDTGIGLYIVVLGGLLIIVGGGMAFTVKKQAAMPLAPMMGSTDMAAGNPAPAAPAQATDTSPPPPPPPPPAPPAN